MLINYTAISKNGYFIIKRIMDIVLSCLALCFFIPLFIVISLIIKTDNPKGHIFYQQIRIGKNGKPFKMYKFRTMDMDADSQFMGLKEANEVCGPMFKIKDDPRITKVGKILRKYSLDEFPQFINVLKGDMSVVGPRPPLEREVEVYSEFDCQRLMIKPGITGLWQVTLRNMTNFKGMLELDLLYIDSLSVKNDLIILIKTVKVVLFPNAAY